MSSRVNPSNSDKTTRGTRTNKQNLKGRGLDEQLVDDLREGGADQQVSMQGADAQSVMVAAADPTQPAPAEHDAASGTPEGSPDPRFEKGVDGKDLDPAVLVEKEPPAMGPAAGFSGWGWVAGGTGAAAAAASSGGGGGGDATSATPSAVPTTPNARLSVDSGASQSDGVTNNAAMSAPTNALEGAKVEYKVDDGAWSTDYVAPTKDGQHTVQVRQTASDGSVSGVQTIQFTLDKTPPADLAKALEVNVAAGADGVVTLVDEKLVPTFTVKGLLAGTGAVVTFQDNAGHQVQAHVFNSGNATADVSGSVDLSTMADGDVTITVAAEDQAGNQSAALAAGTIKVDGIQAPTLTLSHDSGVKGDLLTNDASVAVSANAADVVSRVFVLDGGTASSTYTAPLKQGQHTLTVTDTDKSGNVASASLSFELDSAAPAAPSVALTSDTGASASDLNTKVGTIVLGQLEDKAQVEYSLDGVSGWSTSFVAKEGANTVYVRQTDVAGNVSGSSKLQFTLDTAVPLAPVVKLQADTGLKADDGITSNAALNISAEKGAVVEYSVDGGTTWSTSFSPKEGSNSVFVRQTDLAGNVSPGSALSFTLDTVKPAAPSLSLQADTGLLNNDGTTSDGRTVLANAEAGAKLEYSVDGGTTWAASFAAKEGLNTVQVRQTDAAGNVAVSASPLTFTLDTVAPKSAPTVALAQDSGSSNTDHKTSNAQLSITLSDGGQKAQYSVDGGTTWSDGFTAKEGSNTVTVRQLDLAGNASPSTTFSFELDTAKPAAPTLSLTTDTGASGSDKITQVGQTAITGVEASAVVEYSVDGGTTWVSSFTAKEGNNAVLVRQTDVAGNVSANGSLNFTLDNTAPTKPVFNVAGDNLINLKEQQGLGFTVPKLEAGATATVVFTDSAGTKVVVPVTNTGSSEADVNGTAGLGNLIDGPVVVTISAKDLAGNATTGDAVTLTLDGITTPTIGLHTDSGVAGDKVTNDASLDVSAAPKDLATRTYVVDNGTASASYVAPTAQGTHTVTVTDKDLSGNEASASVTFVLDTLAPKAGPDVKLTDTGASATDGITKNGALGVTLSDGGITTQYSVDGGTTWTSSFSAKEGSNSVLVRQLDLAGNASVATGMKFTLDTTAPAAPTASLLTDSGAANDRYTNVGTLKIAAEEGASVEYSTDNGASWGATFAAKEGSNTVLVRQTDAAGNVSPNASLSFTLDTLAPKTAPGYTFVDTGLANNDGITKVWTPTLTLSDGGVSAQYSTDNGVTWVSSFTPKEGDNTVLVRQFDQAGNASIASVVKITLDTGVPAAPGVVLSNDAGLSSGDRITNVGAVTVSAEKGALVEYSVDGGTTWGTSFAAKEGANTVLVRQTDVAGNVSGNGSLSFTLDTVAPDAPVVVLGTDSGKPGDLITNVGVLVPTVEKGALAEYSVDNGVTWTTGFTAKEGLNTVLVRQTDVAGNVSAGKPFVFTLDTTAPGAPGVTLATDTGKDGGDAYSKLGALKITSETNATVEYSLDGVSNWTSSFTAKEGANTVYVRQTDVAGNVSAIKSYGFTLDTVAPTSAPSVKLANDTGLYNNDGKTYDGALAVSFSDGGVEAEYSIDNGVTWSKTFTAKEGANTVMVRQLDLAGNASVGSGAYSFTLDRSKPVAVSVTLADTGSSSSDKITASPYLTSVSGMEANGATYLEYSLDGGKTWSTTFSPVPNAANNALIRQVDIAGNKSDPTALDFFYDATPPAAADIVVDGGDLLVNLKEQPALGFTVGGVQKVEAGGWVEVTFTDASVEKHSVTVKLSNTGTSATSLTGTANLAKLADGAVTVDIMTFDAAGNGTYSKGATLTLDGIQTPTIGLHQDTNYVGDAITSNPLLDVSTAPADLKTRTFAVSTDDGKTFGAEMTSQPTYAADGRYTVRVTDTDVANNVASSTTTFTLDRTVAAPVAKLLNDTGSSGSDLYTNSGYVGLTNQEAGAVVEYSTDGGKTWSYSFKAVEGSNTVVLRQTDVAGNVSASSASLNFTLDTQVNKPVISLPVTYVDDTGKSDVQYTLSGVDGDVVNTTVAFSDGKGHTVYGVNGHVNLSGLSDGTVTASATVWDKAGNTAVSNSTSLQLDTFSYQDIVSASGNQVVLQFNKAIDPSQLPLAENFSLNFSDANYNPLTGNVHALSVTNVAVSSTDPTRLVLTLGEPLAHTGNLVVSYNDFNRSDLSEHHLASAEGSRVGYFWDQAAVSVAPTITAIRSTHEPEFDIYTSSPGDTLDLQVFFSEPVRITPSALGDTPTLTLSIRQPDGSPATMVATMSPWSGYRADYSVNSMRFSVPLDDAAWKDVTGNWKVTAFNLNGATVNAVPPLSVEPGLALNTSLSTTVPDFAANGWLIGTNVVDLSAANAKFDHASDTVSSLYTYSDPVSAPANQFANVKAGSGTRDAMLVHVLLDTPMTEAEASAYHILYNDTAKQVEVYKEGVSTPVKTMAVPQGTGWPSGMECLYFVVTYKDSNTGDVQENWDEGLGVSRTVLAYEDSQRSTDVFIQGSATNDAIDLSSGVITLTNGQKHTITSNDRIVIQDGPGNDVITGSIASDRIVAGWLGNDTIKAGVGDDRIVVHSWDSGKNSVDGGAGTDTVEIELSGNVPVMHVDAAGNLTLSGGSVNYNTSPPTYSAPTSTEFKFTLDEATNNLNLVTKGTGLGAGSFALTSIEAVEVSLEGNDSKYVAAVQVGTSGNDVLTTNGQGSVVYGGLGNDVLKAMGDHDALIGGSGDDTLVFSTTKNAMISGGAGADTAVALVQAFGPLVASKVSANMWTIVNPNDSNKLSYFNLVKDTTTGEFTLYTLQPSEPGAPVSYNAMGQQVYKYTTLAGVEALKLASPDGVTLGVIDLSNPAASSGVSLLSNALSSDGKSITVDFGSTTLDPTAAKLPAPEAFNVSVNGESIGVTSVAVSGTKVILGLADAVTGGHVYVHYADPSKASDTKALHALASSTDIASFSVDANLSGLTTKITSIRTEDPANLAGYAGLNDSMPLYVHFNGDVSVTAATGGLLPTLTLTVTAPNGSTHTVEAKLVNDPAHGSPISYTDVLRFEAPLGIADVGSVRITATSLALNGAVINTPQGATVNVGIDSSALPLVMSNTYLFGPYAAKDPVSYAGTANNDLVLLTTDQRPGVLTGDFGSISGGASGTSDTASVAIVLPSTVQDGLAASQYELRYNGSGPTKYVEVWKSGGAAAVQQIALPDAAHWPQGFDLLQYTLVYRNPTDGSIEWTDVRPMSFSQTTTTWGSGADFTVSGSMNGGTIDVHTGASLTVSGLLSGTTSHQVVTADHVLVLGGAGNDTITGHDGVDVIHGGAGNNVINAGAGDDVVYFGQGSSNTIDGGAGTDKVHFTLVGNDANAYVDGAGKIHLSGVYADKQTDTQLSSSEQFVWAVDDTTVGSTNSMTFTDVLHGNAVSTVTNTETVEFNFTADHMDNATLSMVFGTTGVDNLSVSGGDTLGFGGAGNDTMTARGASVSLFGGSGDDTLNFGFDFQGLLSGGTGNDKGVMTIGSQLPTLTLNHDSTLVWSLQDVPGHTVIQFEADAAHGGFALKTASGSDLGYGVSDTNHGDMSISGVETLVIQNSVGTVLAKLQLDDTNHTVAVLPV